MVVPGLVDPTLPRDEDTHIQWAVHNEGSLIEPDLAREPERSWAVASQIA